MHALPYAPLRRPSPPPAAAPATPIGLQWQTFGYIPSALPDSNCFGQPAASGFAAAQAPGHASPAASLVAAPPPSSIDSSKVLLLLAAAALRAPRAAAHRA